jgi:DNA-binding response OmpR family regulator
MPTAPIPKILLVDDDPPFRDILCKVLTSRGFLVVEAGNVPSALKLIGSQSFDALLSDLHMPSPGDGLTVVSAMRHSHPNAVTILMSAFPEMEAATRAILQQTDEILVKPMKIDALVDTITDRLARGATAPVVVESVAAILERETQATIGEWLAGVEDDPKITVKMAPAERSAYLPQLFTDLVDRLRNPLPLGTRAHVSQAAAKHGMLRREQGYTAAMLVEESRMLQVSIFQTLQNNLHQIDFSLLLTGVMTIADEVDSQLSQQMASYIADEKSHAKPGALSFISHSRLDAGESRPRTRCATATGLPAPPDWPAHPEMPVGSAPPPPGQ